MALRRVSQRLAGGSCKGSSKDLKGAWEDVVFSDSRVLRFRCFRVEGCGVSDGFGRRVLLGTDVPI